MARLVMANESTAAYRRCFFDLRTVNSGLTPELGEAGGQPQISIGGGAWTNTGIGTLTSIGNGRYYADLTQGAVANPGDVVETRYKSANTVESPGDTFQVVGFNPNDAIRLGLTAIPAVVPAAVGGLPTVDASNAVKIQSGTGANQISLASGQVSLAPTGLNSVVAPPDIATDATGRSSFIGMLRAIFNRLYDEVTQTSSQQRVKNDAGTVVSTMAVSNDGTTQVKGKSS